MWKCNRRTSGDPALIGEVGCRAEQRRAVSQSEREFMDLVFPLAAGQGREVNGDFLQAEDVEVGKLARSAHDAGRVDFPVDPPTPLDVPADDDHLHGLLRSGSAETRAKSSFAACTRRLGPITLRIGAGR